MSASFLQLLALCWLCFYVVRILVWVEQPELGFIKTILTGFPLIHIPLFDFPLLVYLTMVYFIFYGGRLFEKYARTHARFWLIFFLISIFAGWYHSYFGVNQYDLADLFAIISVLIFTSVLYKTIHQKNDFFTRFLVWHKWLIVFCLMYLIAQQILGMQLYFATKMNPNVVSGDGIRYPSYFSDPQLLAQFLAMGGFILLIPGDTSQKIKVNQWVLFVICLAGLLLTGTRSAFFGFCFGLIILFSFAAKPYRKTAFILFIAAGLILALYSSYFVLFNRGTNVNEAFDFRTAVWGNALDIFLKEPLFGIGLGNYSSYVERYYPDQHWIRDNEWVAFDHPESGYLKLLTETGLFGMIALSGLFFLPFLKNAITCLRFSKNSGSFLVSAFVSWLVVFYTVYTFSDVRLTLYVGVLFILMQHEADLFLNPSRNS